MNYTILLNVVTILLGLINGAAHATLITNPSFETVPNASTGQGRLPTGWEVAGGPVPGADTYSNDGSYGLPPAGFNSFPGITAFDGLRWVAGGAFGQTLNSTTVGGESIGTTLTSALSAGATYELEAYLYQSPRFDNPSGYHVFLASENTVQGRTAATLLGALAPTSGADAWEHRTLNFVAPNDSALRTFLILSPFNGVSSAQAYPGIDQVSLTATSVNPIPEPATITVWTVIGLCAAVGAWRRRRKMLKG